MLHAYTYNSTHMFTCAVGNWPRQYMDYVVLKYIYMHVSLQSPCEEAFVCNLIIKISWENPHVLISEVGT